jgi:hypothetical protein
MGKRAANADGTRLHEYRNFICQWLLHIRRLTQRTAESLVTVAVTLVR